MIEDNKIDSTAFFCFSIQNNEEKLGQFSIDNQDLDIKIKHYDKLTILQVYLKESNSWNFIKKYMMAKKFKIFYKKNKTDEIIYESYKGFKIKRKKIKFYYNANNLKKKIMIYLKV